MNDGKGLVELLQFNDGNDDILGEAHERSLSRARSDNELHQFVDQQNTPSKIKSKSRRGSIDLERFVNNKPGSMINLGYGGHLSSLNEAEYEPRNGLETEK